MQTSLEIWSGGQTGVDRAAQDAATELGLPTGGWLPQGRLTEDGPLPTHYAGFRETDSPEYAERTRLNVRDTDATLILRWGEARGGTLETIEIARFLERPLLEINLAVTDPKAAAVLVSGWLQRFPPIRRLNAAGPRASQAPDVYGIARQVLRLALLTADG